MRTVIVIFVVVLLYISLPVCFNVSLNKNKTTICNTTEITRRKSNFCLIIKENWNLEIYIQKCINFYNYFTFTINLKIII
jgi:hypothetical protein